MGKASQRFFRYTIPIRHFFFNHNFLLLSFSSSFVSSPIEEFLLHCTNGISTNEARRTHWGVSIGGG